MQRVPISSETTSTLITGSTVAQMFSIEGGQCRLYMGAVPSDKMAGHMVSGGYQAILPAGLNLYALAESGAAVVAVVGDFEA